MNENVKNLINNMLRAVEYEREEERERHLTEMKYLSGEEREKKGRAIINLRKKKAGRTISGEYLFQFSRKYTIDTEISVGDQIVISQDSPLDLQNPTGIVYDLSNKHVTVAVTKQIRMGNNRPIRLDLSVNDTTYRRMEEALEHLKSPEYSKLQSIFSGKYNVSTFEKDLAIKPLNKNQTQAVDLSFNNNGYYSIQGPPGTGKTYTAAHLIKTIVESGKKVLITADSNAAVDHLIRNCARLGLDPLRIGNPIRVNNDLKAYTLDYRVIRHVMYQDIDRMNDNLKSLKHEQSLLERPKQKDMRGYSYTELIKLMDTHQTGRGISKTTMKDLKPFLKLQKQMDQIYARVQALREEIQDYLLNKHSIIASTNATAGCDLLNDMHFDWVIIDEAAQASIPSAIIPIIKANRFVLIGDHYQLPPVVLNQEAKKLGLDQSLMDYLAGQYPYFLSQLNVQYRMHSKISNLVSHMFYKGKLIAHETVKNRSLDDRVLELYDVVGQERMLKDSKSFYNNEEIKFLDELIASYLKQGIKKEQIAVISPYKAQARLLAKKYPQLEIDTVDAFQGREKDLVIISFVRSNRENKLGFLTDYRRLNVSISRAKCKLVLVGNIKLLETNKLFSNLFKRMT